MTESTGRTPHSEEPAEGGTPSDDQQDAGRTPHPGQAAEGADDAAEEGLDPEDRISGI